MIFSKSRGSIGGAPRRPLALATCAKMELKQFYFTQKRRQRVGFFAEERILPLRYAQGQDDHRTFRGKSVRAVEERILRPTASE